MTDIKGGWLPVIRAARIGRFRFHDCRHHFASRLVQAGVDLNTVRELLGHSDIKMVLRYAHLAPENTAAAVAKLVRNRGPAPDDHDRANLTSTTLGHPLGVADVRDRP